MLLNLLSRIDRSIFKVYVISLIDVGPVRERIETLDIPVFSMGMKRGLPNPIVLWNLIKLIRKLQPDLINSWMYHANIASVLTVYFADRSIPVVWNMTHSIYSLDNEKRLTKYVICFAAKLSASVRYIIYCAKTSRYQHEMIGFCPDKTMIIPNGFDCDRFRPKKNNRLALRKRLGLQGSTPLIGVIGRNHPMKDHNNFLLAMAEPVLHNTESHVLFVGTGMDYNNKKIVHALKELDLGERIHLMGECGNVQDIMSELDIVCLSSYSEAFPNVIGEAMASGVPCVVTDVGDSAWIVGDTGLVVPPREPMALAEACASLLKMKSDDRKALGLRARARIINEFSLDKIVNQFECLYKEILNTG